MPELPNPRHEALARACADDAGRAAARVAAGYSPYGLDRFEHRPAFRARVAELRARAGATNAADLKETVLALLDLAAAGEQATAAARKEARLARLEAWRLNGLLEQRRQQEAWVMPRELTEEEWVAKYGDPAPMPTT
jgi:hypothetical protein